MTYGKELRLTDPFTTLMPGVFAAGDVVHSLHSLEEALREGRDVGQQIHRYLRQGKRRNTEEHDSSGKGNVPLSGSTAEKTTH